MTSTNHGILIHMLFAYLLMYIEVFEDMSSRQYHHILETVRSAREQLYICWPKLFLLIFTWHFLKQYVQKSAS